MRIKSIILKHHRGVALFGRQVVDDTIANADFAAGDVFQPRDHPQQCGLATAGRTDQNNEFAVGNLHADIVDHIDGPERLADAADRH
jgi:hypothetical protein